MERKRDFLKLSLAGALALAVIVSIPESARAFDCKGVVGPSTGACFGPDIVTDNVPNRIAPPPITGYVVPAEGCELIAPEECRVTSELSKEFLDMIKYKVTHIGEPENPFPEH